MSLSATLSASVFGLGGNGGIPTAGNVVLTYPMAASASISNGDWVKLSSTTTGVVVKCSATGDNPIGVAFTTVDNSSGAAGDLSVAVCRRGFAYVDAVITASGTYSGTPITFDGVMYLAGSATVSTDVGQVLSPLTAGTVGTVIVARSFDAVPLPTATAAYRIRVFLDRLGKSTMVL